MWKLTSRAHFFSQVIEQMFCTCPAIVRRSGHRLFSFALQNGNCFAHVRSDGLLEFARVNFGVHTSIHWSYVNVGVLS